MPTRATRKEAIRPRGPRRMDHRSSQLPLARQTWYGLILGDVRAALPPGCRSDSTIPDLFAADGGRRRPPPAPRDVGLPRPPPAPVPVDCTRRATFPRRDG